MSAVKGTKIKRRTKVLALTAALVLAGGAAFAYWTQGGTGTGTADDRHHRFNHGQPDEHRDRPGAGRRSPGAERQLRQPQLRPRVRDHGHRRDRHHHRWTDLRGDRLHAHQPGFGRQRPGPGRQRRGRWGTTDTPTLAFNNKAAENQDDCKNATVQILYTAA